MKSHKWSSVKTNKLEISGGHNVVHTSEALLAAVSKLRCMINSSEYEQHFGMIISLTCVIVRELDKSIDFSMLKESERYVLYVLSKNLSSTATLHEILKNTAIPLIVDLIEILKTYEYIIIKVTGHKLHNDMINILSTISERYEVKYENRDSI